MATTISGAYLTGITLSSYAADNPVSVTNTGTITSPTTDGLYGIGGPITGGGGQLYSWTIGNSGTIGSTFNDGLRLGTDIAAVASSYVTNTSGGVIYGSKNGVNIYGPGAVTNLSGGSITGTSNYGVVISDTGTIVNQGVLLGGQYGAREQQGGSVTNQTGGSITGNAAGGVGIFGSPGTIVNYGSILGAKYGAEEGDGGSVTNQTGGSITGSGTTGAGVYIPVGVGTVVNYGSILGGEFGVKQEGGGSVTNLSGGVITGTKLDGVYIVNGLGTVDNANTIDSGYQGVFLGDGGSVTNQSGGHITGAGAVGVAIAAATGTMINSGAVYGAYTGVLLEDGGSVSNAGGIIKGGKSAAIGISGGLGTIVNDFSLTSNYIGVYETQGGSVTNQALGVITSTDRFGVSISGGAGTIVNYNSVVSAYTGVLLAQGGSVTNNSAGLIQGVGKYGIDISSPTGAIVNAGSIYGGKAGVYFSGAATLTNQSGATISTGILGNDAVLVEGAGTITNAGAIDAGIPAGIAVQFEFPGDLIVDPGATFSGQVNGGAGEIELAGSTAGTLAGFDGTSITNFASLQFDPGASWTISGTTASGGLGSGDLGTPGSFSIGGFTVGDTIQLINFVATSESLAGPGTIGLSDGVNLATLYIQGATNIADFNFTYDAGVHGTDVTATCYAAGTRIQTQRGAIAVEHLREGDLVQTVSGRTQPISWIGHRRVNFSKSPIRQRILPVRIAAHAFGQDLPERELVLSPDHAVFVDDVLIPIRHLVNGSSIEQIECDTITWYHIELPRHDVVLAEGLPAESYLEAGAHDSFGNTDGAIRLHPDFTPPGDHYAMLWESEGYAPLVIAGEQLERIRDRLRQRATSLPTPAAYLSPGMLPFAAIGWAMPAS